MPIIEIYPTAYFGNKKSREILQKNLQLRLPCIKSLHIKEEQVHIHFLWSEPGGRIIAKVYLDAAEERTKDVKDKIKEIVEEEINTYSKVERSYLAPTEVICISI